MWKRLLPILLVLMFGCATKVTTLVVPGIEQSDNLWVNDLRPDTEKQSALFSWFIMSDAYGTFRIADTAVAPPVTRLLQHRAFEKFGSSAALQELKIHHLFVYRNMQSELRRGVLTFALGVVGALIASE